MSTDSIKKDYVQLAINILSDPKTQKDEDLRKWAAAVLDKNSPVPFSSDLRAKLAKEGFFVRVTVPFIDPPEALMTPPIDLKPLPSGTMGDLYLNAIENSFRFAENYRKLVYLQKWATEMKALAEKIRALRP